MSFKDKVVIVTGASAGIGAATAVMFAKEGASVVLVGRNETKLASVTKQCADAGTTPLPVRADVADEEQARTIIERTIEVFGKIDVLVNNAGIAKPASLLGDLDLKVYDDIMRVNLRAVVHLSHLATPHLIKTKGNIVNVSSAAGTRMPKTYYLMAYAMSKAALNHFTEAAAMELAAAGVRVNAVSPGPVKTDILDTANIKDFSWDDYKHVTALGRVGEPQEIGDVILFLASDRARGVTGSNYFSDNGYRYVH